jgi:hypothetical protein
MQQPGPKNRCVQYSQRHTLDQYGKLLRILGILIIAAGIADIGETLPLNLLAFRPNFILEYRPPAIQYLMEEAVREARAAGLVDVRVHGYPGVAGERLGKRSLPVREGGAALARSIAEDAWCPTGFRDCSACGLQQRCPIRKYRARRSV